MVVIGVLFDTNVSQSTCLMGGSSSQFDPYTPPKDYQTFYTPYKASQQTIPQLELIFLLYIIFL